MKGKFGNALEFDAGPYVEVPLSKTNDFTGWEQISVCAWYKTDVLNDEKWMIRDGQVMIGQTAAPNEWPIAIRIINGAWINTEGLNRQKASKGRLGAGVAVNATMVSLTKSPLSVRR